MGVVPGIVILDSAAEVHLRNGVAVQDIDTARRHDGDGAGVGFVGVLVQIGVVVHDVGVVHTCTVSLCLVRLVEDIVFAVAAVRAVASEHIDLQASDGLPSQFALELDVHHIDVDEVVVQFLEDIECSVVARIGSIGVERTRSVEGVAEGVDVEVTADGTADDIDILVERAGRLLLTIAGIRTHGQRHPLRDVERGVDVGRIAVHLAVLRPARIDHGGERSVEVGLITTRSDADGVVVHDVVVEEEVEPVRIAELGLLQISVHGRLGVGESELSVRLVVLVDEGVHLSVQTRRRAVGERCQFEPALLLHLAVDTHLLLRVTDVVLVVAGLAAIGVFAGIVDGGMSGTSFLRGDDNHTGHRARAIDRGGTTVLEHLETFDVVRVQTGNGVGDEGLGIARREVVGTDADGIFHDDAIDHPEGAGTAIDRRCTTHTNLRRGTECGGDILQTHTCHTTFEGAADVRHTVELHLLGIHLRGGAREETAVRLLHTRDDNFTEGVVGHRHHNLYIGRHIDRCLVHTNIRDTESLGLGRNILDDETTLLVRRRTDTRAFHDDVGTDNGLAVCIDDNTCDLLLCEGRPGRECHSGQQKRHFF